MAQNGSKQSSRNSSRNSLKRLSSGSKGVSGIKLENSSNVVKKMSVGKSKKLGPTNGKRTSTKMKKISQTIRSGLTFPVSRVFRMLKNGDYVKRVSPTAAVFLTAALEYMTAEVLELAGNVAIEENRKRISPHHIYTAIKKDDELNNLLRAVTVARGGVVPDLNTVEETTRRKKKKGKEE